MHFGNASTLWLVMPPSNELLGRERVIREVTSLLRSGRSVLLFGPESIGKTAVINAVRHDGLAIVDPLEHVSAQRAYRIRRALDRGVLHLAAARIPQGRGLGAVGRILWRFSTVRVRELPASLIRRIVMRELDAVAQSVDRRWANEVAALAEGRPGFAIEMGRRAAEWMRRHGGDLPIPSFLFATIREEQAIHTLRTGNEAERRPRTGTAT
jgi:hypothetical protein